MKKKFDIEVDCAACAAKIEEAIGKIDGVRKASISFMTQKLVIEADDVKFDEIIGKAEKVFGKVDSDSRIILN